MNLQHQRNRHLLPMTISPSKPKQKPTTLPLITSDDVLHEDENECESGVPMVTDDDLKIPESNDKNQDLDENIFHLPMSHGLPSRSSSCSDDGSHSLQRADTAPIFNLMHKTQIIGLVECYL